MTMINGLHHIGLVVDGVADAVETCRRLGFDTPPPAFPAVPGQDGRPARTFGVGNSHLSLGAGFVEIATVADDPSPDEATIQLIEAPVEALPGLATAIGDTSARLRAALARFQGLHILAFDTPDADATAERLSAAGVWHGGVQRLARPRRPSTDAPAAAPAPPENEAPEPIGYLELDRPERTPEGRLAVAEALPPTAPPTHPNGAEALIEVMLCVPDGELETYADRYRAYLDREPRNDGALLRFGLGTSELVMITASALPSVVPGTVTSAPSFVGYAVAVADLSATAGWLDSRQVPYARSDDQLLVPADQALGAFVAFRRRA